MKLLIAVMTCEKFRHRAEIAQRTWASRVVGADVRFFFGADLDVPDDYEHLRHKVQAAFRWAVGMGYDWIFKTDDDVYVIPDRLLKGNAKRDYFGRVRQPSREMGGDKIYGDAERSYCSGFGYWVSARAAKIVADAADNGDWAEDRFTGQALARAGIFPYPSENFLLWPPINGHFCTIPNPKCPNCRQTYAKAEVICPHAHPEVIESLDQWYLNENFIPTCFEGVSP